MHILLVDDHTLFREALLHVLNQLDEKVFVLEASDTLEATQIISQTRNLDLVLLDIDLPGIDGLTALPELRELAPSVPIVVLSGSEDALDVQRALDNGSVGYIPKSCSSHEMLTALRIILQGDIFVPPRLMSKLGKHLPVIDESRRNSNSQSLLTTRQIEVLKLMADGLPNKSIARTLNLAEGTVKLHVSAIINALNAKNRTHAVTEALRLGITSTEEK
jgi:DNA-binding NarL/FixJ family response regulator